MAGIYVLLMFLYHEAPSPQRPYRRGVVFAIRVLFLFTNSVPDAKAKIGAFWHLSGIPVIWLMSMTGSFSPLAPTFRQTPRNRTNATKTFLESKRVCKIR